MTRPRKFVLFALVAALWAVNVGFAPRATSASPSSNYVRFSCVLLDATAFDGAADVYAAATRSDQFEPDGICFDEDSPDVACCKMSGTLPLAAPIPSIGERRDGPYLRSQRESLAARGPPQS